MNRETGFYDFQEIDEADRSPMNLGILVVSTPEYLPLARITVPNRMEYALRHGYDFFFRMLPAELEPYRLQAIASTLEQVDWLWYQGADVVITNHFVSATRAAGIIRDPDHPDFDDLDLVIGEDRCGINNDSLFIRNCWASQILMGRWQNWKAKGFCNEQFRLAYLLGGDGNSSRVDALAPRAEIIGPTVRALIVPQRQFNAYPDYEYYGEPGHPGTWQRGDFVAHFPGMPLERRIQRCQDILADVLR